MQNNNMMNAAMKSGLTLGLLFTLNFLISLTGVPFIRIIVFAAILYMTFRITVRYRDTSANSYLSYGQSFIFIFFSFFFAALISAFVKFIYFQFINTEYLDEIFNQSMNILQSANFPMMDEMESSLQSVLKPAPYALYSLFGNMLGGVFAGLIISAFTKKEKGIFDENNNNSFDN